MLNFSFGEDDAFPVMDFVKYYGNIVVSLANKTLHVFRNKKQIVRRQFSYVIIKMCVYENKLVLVTYEGDIFILNRYYKIVDMVYAINGLTCVSPYKNGIIVGSRNKFIVVINRNKSKDISNESSSEESTDEIENNIKYRNYLNQKYKGKVKDCTKDILDGIDDTEYASYEDYIYNLEENTVDEKEYESPNENTKRIYNIRVLNTIDNFEKKFMIKNMKRKYKVELIIPTRKMVTSLTSYGDLIAVACEDMIGIYDLEFLSKWNRVMECIINTVIISGEDIYMGLINGKICYDNINGKKDRYSFNAHYVVNESEKIFHSVNYICYNKYLYSSGTDGKIIGWDLVNKKQCHFKYEAPFSIKKFIIDNEYVYILTEELGYRKAMCKLSYQNIEMCM